MSIYSHRGNATLFVDVPKPRATSTGPRTMREVPTALVEGRRMREKQAGAANVGMVNAFFPAEASPP